MEDEVKVRWNDCIDDIWQALETFVHDVALEFVWNIVALSLTALWEEEMQGLAAAIWRLEAAVVAIFNNWKLAEENRDLHSPKTSDLLSKKKKKT